MGLKQQVRGMFEKIFPTYKKVKQAKAFFKTLTAYQPSFQTWNGAIYEELMVKASIDAIARHISKMNVGMKGTARMKLQLAMKAWPCDWMTWSQFLYRLATILEVQTTAWIVPVQDYDGSGEPETVGYFPVLPTNVDVVEVDLEGETVPFIRYRFKNGEVGAVELEKCGIMTKMQYDDDLFGSGNGALNDTVSLMDLQRQGIKEGIKNGATFRFVANASNTFDPEDLVNEMRRFNRNNLQGEGGGLLLLPMEYQNWRQIEPKSFKLDAEETKLIQENVERYFGVNEDVLKSAAFGDKWAAFFDSKLEPFAVQLAQVMTKATFTAYEVRRGNCWFVTANRLQYASTSEKLQVSAQMADRGVMNRNEIREIWGLPPLEGKAGTMFLIRGEYKDADKEAAEIGQEEENENAEEQ